MVDDKNIQDNIFMEQVDCTIQNYLIDAIRNIDIKLYYVELIDANNKKLQTVMTSRLELLYQPATLLEDQYVSDTYTKIGQLEEMLNASNWEQCEMAQKGKNYADSIDTMKQQIPAANQLNLRKKAAKDKPSISSKNALSECTSKFVNCIRCRVSARRAKPQEY